MATNNTVFDRLRVGGYVKIQGLTRKKERRLNGKRGVVVQIETDRDTTVHVHLFPKRLEEIVKIKRKNLDAEYPHSSSIATGMQICTNCQEKLPPEHLKECSRCKVVVYCSRDCQCKHWKIHKRECSHMREIRTSNFQVLKEQRLDSSTVEKILAYTYDDLFDRKELITSMNQRAISLGCYRDSIQILQDAVDEFQPFVNLVPEMVIKFKEQLAFSWSRKGKVDKAVEIQREAIELHCVHSDNMAVRPIRGPPDTVTIHYVRLLHFYAHLLELQGDFEQAISMYEESSKLDPTGGPWMHVVGNMHKTMENDEKSLQAFQQYLDYLGPIDQNGGDRDHAQRVARTYCDMASILMYKSDGQSFQMANSFVCKAQELDPTNTHVKTIAFCLETEKMCRR